MTYFAQCAVWVFVAALTGELVGQAIRALNPRNLV